MSQKGSDYSAVPLCVWCHTAGPDAVHVLGKREWSRRFKVDVPAWVKRLNEAWRSVNRAA
jgi:hypothetical protein